MLSVNPDGSFKASIIGVPTVSFSGSPSISGAVTVVGTPSVTVSNTVSVAGAVQLAGASPASIMTVTRLDNQVVGSMLGMVGQVTIHGLTSAGGGSYVDVKVDPSGALVMASSSVVAFLTSTNASVISVHQGSVAAISTISSVATANGGLPIWSPLGSRVQGTADFRGNSASIAALPAGGAGVRNYVDSVQISNFGSSSVLVVIADNTTSTLGWSIAPAGGGSNFKPFYRGAANSPITASISGTASVLVSMQGFTSGT